VNFSNLVNLCTSFFLIAGRHTYTVPYDSYCELSDTEISGSYITCLHCVFDMSYNKFFY
jgi:hypothetical protein